MFLRCTFGGLPCIGEQLTDTMTDIGQCYSFNKGNQEALFMDGDEGSGFSQLIVNNLVHNKSNK